MLVWVWRVINYDMCCFYCCYVDCVELICFGLLVFWVIIICNLRMVFLLVLRKWGNERVGDRMSEVCYESDGLVVLVYDD